jgi:hypothetical protein
MAFKDGMAAIAKVLEVGAIIVAASWVIGGVYFAFVGEIGPSLGFGLMFGMIWFVCLWTPAWLIRKFIQ